jgi:hypothetical protein
MQVDSDGWATLVPELGHNVQHEQNQTQKALSGGSIPF